VKDLLLDKNSGRIREFLKNTLEFVYQYLDFEEAVLKEVFSKPEEFKKPLRDSLILIRAISGTFEEKPLEELERIKTAVNGSGGKLTREISENSDFGEYAKEKVLGIIKESGLSDISPEGFIDAAKRVAKDVTGDEKAAFSAAFLGVYKDDIIGILKKNEIQEILNPANSAQ